MKRYNPFASALSAAISEITSDHAKRYYINRAQQDLQTIFVLILQFGCFAYACGAQCRQFVNDAEQPMRESGCSAIALYSATSSVLVSDIFVEPVTVACVFPVQPKALPSYQPIALLPAVQDAATTRISESINRFNMNVKELRALAKQNGIKRYSKLSKSTLLSLLAV
jgi:Rho termination factor, N-terminal domain